MRIHIWTASFGYGHNKAAMLFQKELEKHNHTAEIHRPLESDSPVMHQRLKQMYRLLLPFFPGVWRKCSENVPSRVIAMLVCHFKQSLEKALNADMILSVHPLLSVVAAEAKRHRNIPLYHAATDYWDAPMTHHPKINGVFLPALNGQAAEAGQQPVFPLGIPVDAEQKKYTKKECCLEHGWDPDKPLLLVSGGGEGYFPFQKTLHQLNRISTACTLLIVTGTKKWKQRIPTTNHNIVILPFTFRFSDYLQAADILITKAGGMTLAEAALYETPTIIVSPLPGPEEKNAFYFEKRKAAYRAHSLKSMRETIDMLINTPLEKERMKRRLKRIKQPRSTAEITEAALLCNLRNDVSSLNKRRTIKRQ